MIALYQILVVSSWD